MGTLLDPRASAGPVTPSEIRRLGETSVPMDQEVTEGSGDTLLSKTDLGCGT